MFLQFSLKIFTFNWVEKVKKGVGGHLFRDRPDNTPALVLLFLLNRFDGNIFPFVPFDLTSVRRLKEKNICFNFHSNHWNLQIKKEKILFKCTEMPLLLHTPLTVDDLGAFKGERFFGVRFRLHFVDFCEDGVFKVAVRFKVKL